MRHVGACGRRPMRAFAAVLVAEALRRSCPVPGPPTQSVGGGGGAGEPLQRCYSGATCADDLSCTNYSQHEPYEN
eukprot:2049641-Prymnesium_polylepis.1